MGRQNAQPPPRSTAIGSYRWYALGLLTAAQICHYLDRNVMSVVVEPVRREFQLSDSQIGLAAALGFALAYALMCVPMGYLVDRVRRQTLLAGLLMAWSALTAAGGLAQSYLHLALARMGVGAAEAGGSPTAASILADYFGPERRATAMGVWYSSAGLGTGIIFLIGGYIVEHYGWREAFFIAGLPGFLVAVLVLTTLREPRRGQAETHAATAEAPAAAAPKLAEVFAHLVRRPAILHLMAGITLCAAMTSAFALWVVSFFARVHSMPISAISVWVAFAFSVPGVLAPMLVSAAADRIAASPRGWRPERLALVSASTASGVVLVGSAMALAPDRAWALAFMCGWGSLMLAHNGPANALLVSLLQPRIRGVTVATVQMLTSVVGVGLGPYVVGLLSDLYGGQNSLRWAIVTGMVINVWAVCHFLLAARAVRRESVRAAEAVGLAQKP